jgi:membrane protein implicated in regulation of membrane protease activity
MSGILEEIKKQMLTLITAALGFVAALIWKDAISAWLAPLYQDAEGAMGLTLAAVVVTIIVVIVTVILARLLASKEAKESKN